MHAGLTVIDDHWISGLERAIEDELFDRFFSPAEEWETCRRRNL